MYGLVNKGFEDMVRGLVGADGWSRVRERAGVDVDLFVAHQGYPDEMTVRLVGALAEELGTSAEDVLERFGVHWVTKAVGHYGHLLDAAGRTLPEFLQNLPNLHTRVSVSFPHLTPPLFWCTDVGDRSLALHYQSTRTGLVPFVRGLLHGLAARFATPVLVDVSAGGAEGEHVFVVRWGQA